jgi:hypothetical protein
MTRKYRSADDFTHKEDNIEDAINLREIDLYDDELQRIKQLVNERDKLPQQYHRTYDLTIDRIIEGIKENYHDDISRNVMERDIENAKKGGKFWPLFPVGKGSTSKDTLNIDRKKKTSKAKPKRKIVKKRTGKKIVKKLKNKR